MIKSSLEIGHGFGACSLLADVLNITGL